MRRVCVTGAGGFLGKRLCESLRESAHVVAIDLPGANPLDGTEWITIEAPGELARAVEGVGPDSVVHAAFVNLRPAEMSERQYIDNVLAVDLPLFQALAETDTEFTLVSSSAVYGDSVAGEPIDEEFPLRPVTLYGYAKSLQEISARYSTALGLKLCVVRLFNLCGPGQGLGTMWPDWMVQAKAIIDGKAEAISVRHRRTSRDFVDVRDVVRALSMIVDDFAVGDVFNIGSGIAVSLTDISHELDRLCPVELRFVETEPAPSDSDASFQCGCIDRIRDRYGWTPEIDWRTSLKDLWESYA
jgi:nucleoside-diphosphate-sugar epimerase